MNKMLGISLVVMLVSGFNLLSMDKKQDQELREAVALLARKGQRPTQGKRFGAMATIRKQAEAKKAKPEVKENNQEKTVSPLKRLHDDLAAANQQGVVSVKKVKTDGNTQARPMIVVSPNQSPTKGFNRFGSYYVKKPVVRNLTQEFSS